MSWFGELLDKVGEKVFYSKFIGRVNSLPKSEYTKIQKIMIKKCGKIFPIRL